jgi:hypothetical protein
MHKTNLPCRLLDLVAIVALVNAKTIHVISEMGGGIGIVVGGGGVAGVVVIGLVRLVETAMACHYVSASCPQYRHI